jgi:integrase
MTTEPIFNQPPALHRGGRPVKNQPNTATTEALQAALAKAVAANAAHNTPGTVTVNEALDRWLSLHSLGVKPRSVEFNRDIVRHIRRAWPQVLEMAVGAVAEPECVAFAASVAHYSSSRFNGIVNCLRSAIPAAKILPRKTPKHPDAKIPTPEQFDHLLAALDICHVGNSGLLVRLLAHTGMRINEARQLKWEDVRDDHIYLPGETTKNGKPRCVPFIKGTREVLRAYRRVSKGKLVLTQADCRTAMKFACRLLGFHQYSHHTFRHFFATRCIVSGVDIPTVAKWLGHTDGGVVLLKTYCHLLDEHSRAMAERVKLGGNLSNPETLVTLHASAAAAMVPAANVIPMSPDVFKNNPAASPVPASSVPAVNAA